MPDSAEPGPEFQRPEPVLPADFTTVFASGDPTLDAAFDAARNAIAAACAPHPLYRRAPRLPGDRFDLAASAASAGAALRMGAREPARDLLRLIVAGTPIAPESGRTTDAGSVVLELAGVYTAWSGDTKLLAEHRDELRAIAGNSPTLNETVGLARAILAGIFDPAASRAAAPVRVEPAHSSAGEVERRLRAAVAALSSPVEPLAGSVELIARVIDDLCGMTPGAVHAEVTFAPLRDVPWREVRLSKVRIGRTLLNFGVRVRRTTMHVLVERSFGPAIAVRVAPRSSPAALVMLDGVELAGGAARFEATGTHEILFQE